MSEYIVKCKEFVSISGAMTQFPEYIDMNQEIVRCRDCSWFCEGSEVYVTYDWCRNFDCETNEDGYCAWSERRADA